MTAARWLEYCSAFLRKSARSTLPSLSQLTTTTFIPAICADAGLVPWADDGIGADDEQAGIFALCAGIWLQRDRIIAGDLAKLRGKIRKQLGIALGLVRRHEGMDVGEFRPGNRNHFSGRVKLHRTGAKRNHAAVEGEVAIGKPP